MSKSALEFPKEFEVLATYNGERRRGLMHTPAWHERMALLQAKYDQWVLDTAPPGYTAAITRITGWGSGGEDFTHDLGVR